MRTATMMMMASNTHPPTAITTMAHSGKPEDAGTGAKAVRVPLVAEMIGNPLTVPRDTAERRLLTA